jgi:hypothetical protein
MAPAIPLHRRLWRPKSRPCFPPPPFFLPSTGDQAQRPPPSSAADESEKWRRRRCRQSRLNPRPDQVGTDNREVLSGKDPAAKDAKTAAEEVAPAVVTGSVVGAGGGGRRQRRSGLQEMHPALSCLPVLRQTGLVNPTASTEKTGYALNSVAQEQISHLMVQYLLRLE